MPGYPSIPYRPPCYGWVTPPRIFINCNVSPPPATLPNVFENKTTVADYADPPGADIPPYSRPYIYCLGGGGAGYESHTPGTPLVGPWTLDEFGCDGGEVVVGENCYHDTGTPITWNECADGYFKNVQALKTWHGRFGFNDHDPGGISWETLGEPCNCNFEAGQSSPNTTKYLDETLVISYTNDCVTYNVGGGPSDHTYHDEYDHTRAVSVDSNSGYPTLNTCTEVYAATYTVRGGDTDFDCTIGTLGDVFDCAPSDPGITTCAPLSIGFDEIESMKGIQVTGGFIYWPTYGSGHYGTVPYTVASLETELASRYPGSTITVTLSNTELHVHIEYSLLAPDPIPEDGHYCTAESVFDLTLTLGSTYTAATLWSDAVLLAAEWDLADDAVYPWRADSQLTMAPLVKRRELEAPSTPHLVVPCEIDDGTGTLQPWLHEGYTAGTANPNPYTGEIVGTPNPAGYARHFDRDHRNFIVCGGITLVQSYGAFSASPIPESATCWTENYNSSVPAYPGPFAVFGGGQMRLQKWAECRVKHPSVNYFRPCGADRYAIDETLYVCISSHTSGTPDVIEVTPESAITTGTKCVAYGAVWSVTRVDSTHFELTTHIVDLPGDIVSDPNSFGPLRFPNAWPICGRIAATATVATGTVTVVLAEPAPYLRTGDAVDFTDVDGTVTESNKTVTVVDSTHFTFSGAAVPTGGYCIAHGAPKWYWHDNQSKGEYQWLTWSHDFRDYGEADRLCAQFYACNECEDAGSSTGCENVGTVEDPVYESTLRRNQAIHGMPRSVEAMTVTAKCFEFACRSVICISPNTEGWTPSRSLTVESITLPSIVADERYGALWQGQVRQIMDDPFHQSPHSPLCGTADPPDSDGLCHSVEARDETLPDDGGPGQDETAPALPANVFLNILTLGDLDTSGDPPDGVIILPPSAVTDNSTTFGTAWGDAACL